MNFYKFYKLITENSTISDNDRIHLSNIKLQDNSRRIVGDSSGNIVGVGDKPKGLWYGFGDDWLVFARMNIYDLNHSYKYAYKIYPNLSKMIILKTAQDVIDFSKKNIVGKNINWNKVAQNYSGIEMPTYYELGLRGWGSRYSNDQENLENDIKNDDFSNLSYQERVNLFSWLYLWDVASGCIWKPDGLIRYEEMIHP